MNRLDFQELAELRLKESKALLATGFPDGAYYLAGYAVECALKACIAKRTREHDFPDQQLVNSSYTHKLNELVRLALLQDELKADPTAAINWEIVKSWSEQSRYKQKGLVEATELLNAIDDGAGGILPWVRKHW